jgi:tetratricopeptide (TPR) repeat protein
LETPGMAEQNLRLVAALGQFWHFTGNVREGLDWMLGALALPGMQSATVARVKALRSAGRLQTMPGNYDRAQQFLEESIQLAKVLGDRKELAYGLGALSWLRGSRSDPGGALSLSEEALALFRESGDQYGLAIALSRTAQYRLFYNGDTSLELVEESLTLFQTLGNQWGYANAGATAGVIYAESGDYAHACSLFEQAAALFRRGGQRRLLVEELNDLGEVSRCLGDYQAARNYFEESLALARELGYRSVVTQLQHGMGYVALRQADHDLAAVSFQESLMLAAEQGIVQWLAGCFAGIAGVATAIGQERRAAQLLGAEETLFNKFGARVDVADRMDYDYILQTLSGQMDAQALAEAWAEGRTLSQEQAIVLALEIAQLSQER